MERVNERWYVREYVFTLLAFNGGACIGVNSDFHANVSTQDTRQGT